MWLLLIPPAALLLALLWTARRRRPTRAHEAMITIEGYRRMVAALAPDPNDPADAGHPSGAGDPAGAGDAAGVGGPAPERSGAGSGEAGWTEVSVIPPRPGPDEPEALVPSAREFAGRVPTAPPAPEPAARREVPRTAETLGD
ncbi:hypothetical protein I6A84_41450 [Frankia sp. CNm7]|uniref:Uncharacterized protein n=1 Tax=Frankia nepalensis TaxID=1836974 RepID=A0A937RMZ0_9ACTN|nr:hypothetical protein [Frankia nepalensis]MBL7500758.1 hypothetical protein [Frankia nepalensis]MBL7511754.1 hypothetical protein [Frankia nepalensis]MBL7524335.1 hypothetical protein [Frankia nepalensis]MBL7633170.1 hypothetical protein [Frankia nepalensis]